MLYTWAQDKTYRDETNDSLISVAVDYYRHTDDVRHKFLSCYYKGRVHFNAKDYLNAVTCYMEVEQLAEEVMDDWVKQAKASGIKQLEKMANTIMAHRTGILVWLRL